MRISDWSSDVCSSDLLVFVEIVLDRTTPDVFDQFARAVRDMPEVLECHMVAGGFDYLIKVRVRDMEAYRQFLGASLTSLPGVRETHTYAVMEEIGRASGRERVCQYV